MHSWLWRHVPHPTRRTGLFSVSHKMKWVGGKKVSIYHSYDERFWFVNNTGVNLIETKPRIRWKLEHAPNSKLSDKAVAVTITRRTLPNNSVEKHWLIYVVSYILVVYHIFLFYQFHLRHVQLVKVLKTCITTTWYLIIWGLRSLMPTHNGIRIKVL